MTPPSSSDHLSICPPPPSLYTIQSANYVFVLFGNRFRNENNSSLDQLAEFYLNWQDHVNSIANKISKYIGILNRLKRYLTPKTLLLMYNTFILSSLNYGILVWGYNTDWLFKLQKRAVRLISKSKFNGHTDPIFKNLQILKIDLHKLRVLKFYYQLIPKNIPDYFCTNMTHTQHSHVHSYQTGNNKKTCNT